VAIIFSTTLTANDTGWGGTNIRVVVPKASLSAGPSGQIRVTLRFASSATSASTVDSVWIGTGAASGNAYNFTGDQVQLKFSGSNSFALSANLAITSDWANFAYLGTGSNLQVALHLTGTTADGFFAGTGPEYYLVAADNGGTTAPAGVWTTYARFTFVQQIETQSLPFTGSSWWPSEDRPRRLPVDTRYIRDSEPPLRNRGILVPTTILPPPFWDNRPKWALWNRPVFDQPEFWRNRGILVPTVLPPQPWFDPPRRLVAPSGFDPNWVRPLGTTIPPPEPFWDYAKKRQAPPGFDSGEIPLPTAASGVIAHVGDGGYNSGAESGGTASVTLAFPSGIANGNLVIAAVCDSAQVTGSTIATPTGWTKIGDSGENMTSGTGFNRLYLFGAIYSGGLTSTFVASGQGAGNGIDGEIKGFSGTGATIGTALGNFTFVAPSATLLTAIPGPTGFTSGQWNYWAAMNYNNPVSAPSSSPTASNTYYNSGVYDAFFIGTTVPGSAPGTETLTWTGTAGNFLGVGVTILPGAAAAPATLFPGSWFTSEQRRPGLPVDKPQVWDNQQPLRNLGTTVPTAAPVDLWFDPPKRWRAPPGFEIQDIQPLGTTVPTAAPADPWFDPPKRWKAPPPFEVQAIPFLGIPVPTAAPQSEFWQAVRQPSRQTIWDMNVLQPFAAAVVQPSFVSTDFWSTSRRTYSTVSWDGNYVIPLAVITPVPSDWWTAARAPYRVQVWDSNQTPQFFGITVPTAKPSEPWFDPPKRWKAPPGFEHPAIPPFGTTVPTSKPSEPWFDPPKRWIAPPGFEPPPWRNLGTTVPTAKPSEPWFDPPQRWLARQWFEVTWFQNYGIQVPTAKPSEPWFDPPIRWKAGPGFEPHTLKQIIPGTPTPSSALPTPWFDPPQRWTPRQWFEVTWFRNLGTTVPTAKPSEPWFDPPKRWIAPPGFDPTYERPFGTQVPTSALPVEWWTSPRRWLQVSIWTPDVFRPLVAAVVTPSYVSADFWVQAKRQAAALSWDGVSPLSPAVSPPFIGADWWQTSLSSAVRAREWWQFIPPGARLVPYMDQAWWGLTSRTAARVDWQSPITPPVGVSGAWQAAFFDTTRQARRAPQDWALGSFFAFTGIPVFVRPLQIVNAPTQTIIAKGEPVISTVYDIDIVSAVNSKPVTSVVYATDIVNIVKK